MPLAQRMGRVMGEGDKNGISKNILLSPNSFQVFIFSLAHVRTDFQACFTKLGCISGSHCGHASEFPSHLSLPIQWSTTSRSVGIPSLPPQSQSDPNENDWITIKRLIPFLPEAAAKSAAWPGKSQAGSGNFAGWSRVVQEPFLKFWNCESQFQGWNQFILLIKSPKLMKWQASRNGNRSFTSQE